MFQRSILYYCFGNLEERSEWSSLRQTMRIDIIHTGYKYIYIERGEANLINLEALRVRVD